MDEKNSNQSHKEVNMAESSLIQKINATMDRPKIHSDKFNENMEGPPIHVDTLNVYAYGQTTVGQNNTINVGTSKTSALGVANKIKNIPDDIEHFVGRTDVLDTLKESFYCSKVVILHGMAGTGKSTVATKFAYQNGLQYQNRVWVNMNEVSCFKENAGDAIFRHILKNFYININDIKESDDISFHLQATFRRLYSERKQTLVILDNLDEFLVVQEDKYCGTNLLSAIRQLFDIAIQSGQGMIHILGTSQCKADEQCFRGLENVELMPFTPEESRRYLEPFPDVSNYSIDLHESSCGFPLILELFSKCLSRKDNSSDFTHFLKQIQEQPCKTVLGSSKYIKQCLTASINILSKNEMQLAEALSFFAETISIDYAEDFCKEVEIEFSCVHQLVDKGVIKSTGKGYSMHPFVKEIIKDRVNAREELHYKTSLALIYIKALLQLSNSSFEKNRLAPMVKEFQDRMSSFNHLMSILDSFSSNDRETYMTEVNILTRKGTFAEQDPCFFFLLLRFLYYLVPRNNIRSIFQFLLDSSSKENTRYMLKACLDELEWDLSDEQPFCDNSRGLEFVMFRHRQLSDKVSCIINRTHSLQLDISPEMLEKDLCELLNHVEMLNNKKIKAYYTVKVNKLLGNLALSEKNPIVATGYFKTCCSISDSTFGASFWSIDSYKYLAQGQDEIGARDSALESFGKGLEMAQNAGLFCVPVICTLYWAYAKFCLKHESLREKARELLSIMVDVSYHHSKFDFLSKAKNELCINFPDEVFIGMVSSMFEFNLGIKGRSTDREVIQKKTMAGIDILKSGIADAKRRVENDIGDKALLEDALFNWNRNIALYCSHVLLEEDRKPYANEALTLAEHSSHARGNDIKLLKLVRDSNNSDEVQKIILDVSFLEKTNKHRAKCMKDEQNKKITNALESCQQNWLILKLKTCQLELINGGGDASIGLMEDIANILSAEKSVQFKPIIVMYNAIQNIDITELANQEKLQLNCIYLKCIKNLRKGSSKKEKGMECNFQMCQIDLLQQFSYSDPKAIMVLMQKVLDYGKKNKTSKLLKVVKDYQKYIDDHSSSLYQVWIFINEILLFLV